MGYKSLESLLKKNQESAVNENAMKIVTTYSLSDQHLSINSKVILQMFTKLTAKWNQLTRQMIVIIALFCLLCRADASAQTILHLETESRIPNGHGFADYSSSRNRVKNAE